MNVQFVKDGVNVGAEVVLTWRPVKGDHVCIESREYIIPEAYEFTYDIDNAKWFIVLEDA